MQPTVSQVLAQGGAASLAGMNMAVIALAGLAVFLVSALSAYKGYESFRRGRLMAAVIDEKPSLAEIEKKEKVERASFMLQELSAERNKLAERNTRLEEDCRGLNDAWLSSKKVCETLEKSNQALAKENDKLKAEKEGLVLAASKPLVTTRKIKAQAKIKRRAERKPKRVLPKRKK